MLVISLHEGEVFVKHLLWYNIFMPNPTLHVRVISPKKLLLDTEATSVSSKNSQGPFDILPQHANFITVIENSPIIIRHNRQKPITFNLPLAIILTMKDSVNIYTY